MAGVQSLTKAEYFSSNLCIQTGSGAHQPPVQWVPGALSWGLKRSQGVMLTMHSLLVLRLRKSRRYTSCHPNMPLWSVTGPLYLFFYLIMKLRSGLSGCFASEVYYKYNDTRFYKIFKEVDTHIQRSKNMFSNLPMVS
jgi:hypothetical protein